MTTSFKRLADHNEFDLHNVGSRVRAARQAVGYSIEDLAETCGLTSAEILAVEEGLEGEASQLKRIAQALQVSLGELTGDMG